MAYTRRVLDEQLDAYLAGLPAISIEGAKGVGKTATALRRATTAIRLDDELQRRLVDAGPDDLETMPGPVLLDEWQRHPRVWDLVRRSVDAEYRPGRYLLTGSAIPVSVPIHSGAGRIVSVHMRPMSLAERGLEPPAVSLRALFTGDRAGFRADSSIDLAGYTTEILRSGFPGIRALPGDLRAPALDSYLDRVVTRDFAEQGRAVRHPATLRHWLGAYAAATATTASYNTILDAATPGESDKPAKTTTIAYRDVLEQLFVVEPLPGWMPVHSAFSRLGQSPKHHLVDPALAARLLNVDAEALLRGSAEPRQIPRDGPLLGSLFESLVTQSVRVYAQVCDARVHHLRSRNGDHEIDLVVEGPGRRVVAFEVKLAPSEDDEAAKHLLWLQDRLGDDLADAAIITTGPYAYRRKDGIAVIPASLLGP